LPHQLSTREKKRGRGRLPPTVMRGLGERRALSYHWAIEEKRKRGTDFLGKEGGKRKQKGKEHGMAQTMRKTHGKKEGGEEKKNHRGKKKKGKHGRTHLYTHVLSVISRKKKETSNRLHSQGRGKMKKETHKILFSFPH